MTEQSIRYSASSHRLLIAIAGMVCTAFGTVCVLHGLGLVSAAWLRPNPEVPAPVFVLIGAMMLLAAVLIMGRLTFLPRNLINVTGYGVFALSLVLAHWLIFLSKGGRCVLSAFGGSMVMNHMLCAGVFGALLGLTDLIIIAIIATRLWPNALSSGGKP